MKTYENQNVVISLQEYNELLQIKKEILEKNKILVITGSDKFKKQFYINYDTAMELLINQCQTHISEINNLKNKLSAEESRVRSHFMMLLDLKCMSTFQFKRWRNSVKL